MVVGCGIPGLTVGPTRQGVQMDETAFPILLCDMLNRAGAIEASEPKHYERLIEAAAGYIVRAGPTTQQDRWRRWRLFSVHARS
jgi:hypothetical protein